MENKALTDGFGRRFPYLRLSVTDVCNFSCSYCLPHGHLKKDAPTVLSVPEIRRVVTAFAGVGTWKIRLTGGEPTVRPDFCEIAREIANITGIRKLVFTTNGYRLPERAQEYFDAGLRAVNVSIDSLDSRKFYELTKHDRLKEVVEGVEAAVQAGFDKVKINVVLMKGVNDEEIDGFLDFVAERKISLRFIELMQTKDNKSFFGKHHLSAAVVREGLLTRGWHLLAREEGAGPALEYAHKDYQGTVGIIAPYARDFCASCNRLRMSARGKFHLCLFGEGGHDIRHLMQDDDQTGELQSAIRSLLLFKKETHFLHQGDSGATPHLASIGG